MVEHRQQNKRILKNTFFLYIRMAIMMIVSLFTSRITLRALGVEDYGIYNVVGGIVIFLAFLAGNRFRMFRNNVMSCF